MSLYTYIKKGNGQDTESVLEFMYVNRKGRGGGNGGVHAYQQ